MSVMAERKRPDPAASPRHRQQRVKNWTMLLILLAMVALFFVLSIVRMGGAPS